MGAVTFGLASFGWSTIDSSTDAGAVFAKAHGWTLPVHLLLNGRGSFF